MNTYTVTVENIHAGQRGPYADHNYESRIHVSGRIINQKQAKELAHTLIRNWTKDIGETGHMGETFLQQCDLASENRNGPCQTWHIKIMQPFCG